MALRPAKCVGRDRTGDDRGADPLNFTFLHAADIHLDSPLLGLGRIEGAPAELLRGATRRALEEMVELAIREGVAFVIIAGDLWDGDWRDVGTGHFAWRTLGRLVARDIPVYVLRGNHDAASRITTALPPPVGIQVLAHGAVQTVEVPGLPVRIHGRSFATAAVTDDLVPLYPTARGDRLEIGMLHTCLDGKAGHARYAPTSLEALVAKGYQYWALGHVHARQVLHRDPWIVFPGNIQARHINEPGAKGAMLVDVEDDRIVDARFVALDNIRYERIPLVMPEDRTDLPEQVRREVLDRTGQGRLDAARLTVLRLDLAAPADRHGRLLRDLPQLTEECRSILGDLADQVWIQDVVLQPAEAGPDLPAGLDEDLTPLLEAELADPATRAEIRLALKPLFDRIPGNLLAHVTAQDLDAAAAGDLDPVVEQARALVLDLLRG